MKDGPPSRNEHEKGPRLFNASVVFNRPAGRAVFLMALEAGGIASGAWPGRFVMLRIGKGTAPLLRRPFSICGTVGHDMILVLYRVAGAGTSLMATMSTGEALSVLGPLGAGFDLSETTGEGILVGGGIGVAPLVFLAQKLGPEGHVFLAGFPSAADMIDMGDEAFPRLHLSVATEDGTRGHTGRVTELLEARLAERGTRDAPVFACGPPAMLRRTAAVAKERNLRCQVSMEAFMACGVGACQGCAVSAAQEKGRPFLLVCQDGPVFDAERLWRDAP